MAGIFSKMGDLYKLQSEARNLQKKLKQIEIEGISRGREVVVLLNGENELIDIAIEDNLLSIDMKDRLREYIREAMKDAHKKIQKTLSKSMDMGKIKELLGA